MASLDLSRATGGTILIVNISSSVAAVVVVDLMSTVLVEVVEVQDIHQKHLVQLPSLRLIFLLLLVRWSWLATGTKGFQPMTHIMVVIQHLIAKLLVWWCWRYQVLILINHHIVVMMADQEHQVDQDLVVVELIMVPWCWYRWSSRW